MSTTPGDEAGGAGGAVPGIAERMGIVAGMVVQEVGWDSAVDEEFRNAVEELLGDDLIDEDADEIVDAVILWYREGDGDLVDALVDAISPLADNGFIWLLTPKRGRPGYVEPSDIAEAAPTAGLSQTSMATVGADWAGTRLASRKSRGDRK
ncbi:MAG TPA: DUF3052 domain-containing protein [Jatrophihabitantaceae bacterium]